VAGEALQFRQSLLLESLEIGPVHSWSLSHPSTGALKFFMSSALRAFVRLNGLWRFFRQESSSYRTGSGPSMVGTTSTLLEGWSATPSPIAWEAPSPEQAGVNRPSAGAEHRRAGGQHGQEYVNPFAASPGRLE
jgi:hypothetical protein